MIHTVLWAALKVRNVWTDVPDPTSDEDSGKWLKMNSHGHALKREIRKWLGGRDV